MLNLYCGIKDKIEGKRFKNSSLNNYIILEKPVNVE